jgi:hypothetical protein
MVEIFVVQCESEGFCHGHENYQDRWWDDRFKSKLKTQKKGPKQEHEG